MSSVRARLFQPFLCALCFIAVAKADPNNLTFSTINPTGSTATIAGGANNLGQIVGTETVSGGTLNAFLLSGGLFTTFNVTPNSMAGSYAEGINNNGLIVGQNLADGTGFLLSGGTFTSITVPGSDSGTTNATAINILGQIAGTYQKGGVQYGFFLSGGVFTTVSVPGATATFASGLSDNGQIVGWYVSGGVTYGFSLSGSTYTTLIFPGATVTKVHGLNNSGQLVGEYSSGGATTGFLLQGGFTNGEEIFNVVSYNTVNAPGSTKTVALGINDAGQIVGSYTSGGTVFGFSATQDTEPILLNQYPVPNQANSPSPITAGPDGALWFILGSGHGFGRVSTLGAVTEYGSTPSTGAGITTGPDGALWFTLDGFCTFAGCGPGSIGKITTSGVITMFSTQPSRPGGIVTGPDGALWYSDESQIGRITTSGVVTTFPISVGGGGRGIAAGPDGALWFAGGTGQIGRITTSGVVTEYPLPSPNASTLGIVAGPDGALWFTENNTNQIGRITTSGAVTEYPVPTANASLSAIALGPDGALWFAEPGAPKIGRITTSGVITEWVAPAISGIAGGADAQIWLTEPASAQIGQIVNATGRVPPLLGITETHTGSFTQGQNNATYTVTVSNSLGVQSTVGTVTVTDTLPSGLSLVSMAGVGWSCVANTCTRSDALPGGYGYPPITVTVNVAPNASTPETNQVTVLGGGSLTASASDVTTIMPVAPQLSVSVTNIGIFSPGQTNATYTITVSNTGSGATYGAVTVTDVLPAGLTLVSMAGAPPCTATSCNGWTCTLNSCTRSDGLAPGASYPAIIVTVNVAANASSPQVNTVNVSGGGSPPASATDSTIIGTQHPPFFNGEQNLGSGVYYLKFPDGNLFGFYTYLAGSILYHYDMGFEYVLPANDANGDVYFYDFTSGHWWYTGPSLFPNLYDFTLGAWIYYFPDTSNPGHYTTNPRKFAFDGTQVTFPM